MHESLRSVWYVVAKLGRQRTGSSLFDHGVTAGQPDLIDRSLRSCCEAVVVWLVCGCASVVLGRQMLFGSNGVMGMRMLLSPRFKTHADAALSLSLGTSKGILFNLMIELYGSNLKAYTGKVLRKIKFLFRWASLYYLSDVVMLWLLRILNVD
jgi:hypothetical protein